MEKMESTTSAEPQDSRNASPAGVVDALQSLVKHAGLLTKIEADRAKLRIYRGLACAALGFLALCGLATLATFAALLTLFGTAAGLGEQFGGRLWLGAIVAGLSCLLLIACSGLGILHFYRRQRLLHTCSRYGTTVSAARTEDEFLSTKSASTKAEITVRFLDLRDAVSGSSVVTWVQTHPLLSSALAASATFAVGNVIFSRQSEPMSEPCSKSARGDGQTEFVQWVQIVAQILQSLK